ncbi:MAG: glycosyltransferase [Gammaproteobacteria bacterium]|nr:glycosyltransferase [Gammaproteobacteria bacterium]
MKVLLITKNFNLGGAEAHVCELANTLVDFGHDVILISKEGQQKNKLDPKVKHYIWKITDLNYFPNVLKLKKLVQQEKVDIIHGHQRLAISMAALVGKLCKIPVIATAHGKIKYDLRSNTIRKRIDKAICVRESSLKKARDCKYLKDKSSLILNGVKSYANSRTSTEYTLMYGSRIDKRHGWVLLLLINKVLLRLRRDYPSIKLVVWGDGQEKPAVETAAMEANTQYPKLVELNGYTETLGAEYKAANLALACARSAMDALVAGTNVLLVNFHHLGEVIQEDNYEYYKGDNFEAKRCAKPDEASLYEGIKGFFEKQEWYEQQMHLLEGSIQNDLVVESSVRKIEQEYQKLVSS